MVLLGRLLDPGTIVVEGDRVIDVAAGASPATDAARHVDLHGHSIVPGFVDVHVHGLEGHDVLEDAAGLDAVARHLPRYGVTAFCPTSVACPPARLRALLDAVRLARSRPIGPSARVLPAHLESNFLDPEYRGAQPRGCLRLPPVPTSASSSSSSATDAGRSDSGRPAAPAGDDVYTGADVLAEIARGASEVGIVTLAPELPRGLDLVRALTPRGHVVSMGHSGADFDQGLMAVAAGARQATHLFNRMPPISHRAPGLVGAILQEESVAAEVVCDGFHVHPAMVRMAVAAKGPARIMAITDGTAAAGLAAGTQTYLGGQPIVARPTAAFLADGTLAGSVCTMDRAFRFLVETVGLTLIDAATICATTPARELGLHDQGAIAVGSFADLTVLDRHLQVVRTYLGGTLAYSAPERGATA